MAKSKLSRQEAEEFTSNLGQVAVGNFGLMEMAMHTLRVPDALGMTNEDWVQERLGGYIRWSVSQRREAVRELSGERNESGRYERSDRQVAEILGISTTTVVRDREVIEALERPVRSLETTKESAKKPVRSPETRKLSPQEKKTKIRELIEQGMSDAAVAVQLDIGVSTVAKERTAMKKEEEAARAPSEKYLRAKIEQEMRDEAQPEAEKKAIKAEVEEQTEKIVKAVGDALGIGSHILDTLQGLRKDIQTVMDDDLEIPDYEKVLALWADIGTELWVHGARRGYDVSVIAKTLDKLRGGDES